MPAVHRVAIALLALASGSFAQTYTSCNPTTNSSCPSDTGLTSTSYSVDFTQGSDDDNWSSVGTGDVTYTSSGAGFTISEKGEAPTIQTSWYFFFGRAEVHMRAASGTGIVSSVVLESDDLDEVDWEWIGGDVNEVQTNYFGKGNTTSYDRGGTTTVSDTQGTTHNYTIDWTSAAITWYLDGVAVRTLAYADALDGKNFPQTPMRLKLGIWAGGDSDNAEGTIEWAGGETDYDNGPYTMYVESVSVTNANPGSSYTYSDQTGDWTSITIDSSSNSSNEASSDAETTTGSSVSSTTSSSSTARSSSNVSATASSTSASTSKTSTTSAAVATSTVSAASPMVNNTLFLAVAVLAATWLL
ncbi:concanavalin A-like lectin/glucanase [Thozetella sp. PMI_491]|nr:concanavalin A-like lectin/glucanase [Thozetella sp. PMI_491]